MIKYLPLIKLLSLTLLLPLLVATATLSRSFSLWRNVTQKEKELRKLTVEATDSVQWADEIGCPDSTNDITNQPDTKVVKYNRYSSHVDKSQCSIVTCELVLTGECTALVMALNRIEKTGWVVTSHRFSVSIDRSSQTDVLLLTLILQQIEKGAVVR